MNRIPEAFRAGKAFIPYITGGDPDLETTEKLIYTLTKAGADAIEIGIPFSDPAAEGPVIQAANQRALEAGCTAEKLLDLVARIRTNITIPLLFMTYYNPVFVYGVSKFTNKCAAVGIDGLIVPDLPLEERDELLEPCISNELELISLIAPTSAARMKKIATNSGGFLYCVSSMGVTGERHEIDSSARHMIEQIKKVTDTPCAVGFGISTPEQAHSMAAFADGVIVGSAIVRTATESGKNCEEAVLRFAKSIKQAISNQGEVATRKV